MGRFEHEDFLPSRERAVENLAAALTERGITTVLVWTTNTEGARRACGLEAGGHVVRARFERQGDDDFWRFQVESDDNWRRPIVFGYSTDIPTAAERAEAWLADQPIPASPAEPVVRQETSPRSASPPPHRSR